METNNTKTNKEIKTNARGQLIGRYPVCIMVAFLVSAIELTITSITESNYTGSIGSYLLRFVISLVVDLLMGILIYGQSRFFLNMVRGKEPLSVSDVFYGVKNNVDKAIMVQSVFTLASFIGSLPAVLVSVDIILIPKDMYYPTVTIVYAFSLICSFVAKLFLGLSFYILNDRPELSVIEIYKESMRLMTNKKGRYFTLCLSMIPLLILSICAFFVGVFWFVAYYQTVLTNFYLNAIGEEPYNPTVEKETSAESEPVTEETTTP